MALVKLDNSYRTILSPFAQKSHFFMSLYLGQSVAQSNVFRGRVRAKAAVATGCGSPSMTREQVSALTRWVVTPPTTKALLVLVRGRTERKTTFITSFGYL